MEENKSSIYDKVEVEEVDTSKIKDVESARFESRNLPKVLHYCTMGLMLATALYHIYAAFWGGLPGIQHTAVHVGCGMAIIFLLYPFNKSTNSMFCLTV